MASIVARPQSINKKSGCHCLNFDFEVTSFLVDPVFLLDDMIPLLYRRLVHCSKYVTVNSNDALVAMLQYPINSWSRCVMFMQEQWRTEPVDILLHIWCISTHPRNDCSSFSRLAIKWWRVRALNHSIRKSYISHIVLEQNANPKESLCLCVCIHKKDSNDLKT